MLFLFCPAGCGAHHYEAASKLRARDSSRLLHYESGGIRVGASDVICPMYARVKTISKWSKDKTVSVLTSHA